MVSLPARYHMLLEENNIKYIADASPFPKRKEKEIFAYSDGCSDGAGGRGSCFGIGFFFAAWACCALVRSLKP